ncbi:MAG TPA: DUF6624 domain-containing protein, partial [Bacteroidia bacterium]
DWLVYDSTGVLVKKETYKEGNKISEINYKRETGPKINDSLVIVLKMINQEIYKYHDSVRLIESSHGKKSTEYQRTVSLNALHTSKLLEELDKIISKFGYPGKTLAGTEYTIAFSIISIANTAYKEKYAALIVDAANKGELDWTDVAFFVDKLKVAKKEKQTYGTQYKFDEQKKKILYYPVEDPANLNERRKKVGLHEMEYNAMEFINY